MLDHIGRYEIRERLGRGGMASVYRGFDPRFEREVAIKILPLEMVDDPQFRARFEREARAIAALEHPSIVPVYDFAEENGQPFIVMRLMKGGSLAERLKKGPLSLVEAQRVLERLGQALDAAHARGIIHRDLKPGNILFDEYDNAYLSDFGIVHIANAGASLTGTGMIGTPAYMSPEQVQGGMSLDARSDVYSLGIILYQMLSGQTPFQADTPARVMMAHILESPRSVLDIRPELPPACHTVLEKALAKEREARYDSAGALAAAFKQVVLGEAPTPLAQEAAPTRVATPPAATPTAAARRAHTLEPPGQAKKSGAPIAAAAIGLVLLAVLGFGSLFLWRRFSPAGSGSTPQVGLNPALGGTQTAQALVLIPQASATPSPSATATPSPTPSPSPFPSPSATATPMPSDTPAPLALGGGDMLAFLRDNDVWVVRLDGSDLQQLTNDGGKKTLLQWLPDGSAVTYILGTCVHSVAWQSGRDDILMCVQAIETLEDFRISPDGSQVAISMDRQMFVVPFDRDALAQVRFRTDVQRMGQCAALSPYTRNAVKQARWSADGSQLALKIIGNNGQGQQVDLIQVISIQNCPATPPRLDEFPAQRFTMNGYDKTPIIQNYSWDGVFLFALTGFVRNDGFGDLYIYNRDLHKADREVNPVDGVCCYRDPSFSPNGQYLALAFQDIRAGADNPIALYYVDLNTLGTGVQYSPIPLPEGFFTNPREHPQPIVRPAQP